jgi:hypothetical protein
LARGIERERRATNDTWLAHLARHQCRMRGPAEAGTIYLGQCHVAVDRPEAELAEIERWRTKSLEHS